MEREVELVLKETGLGDAAALLRANGVYNLESMRVLAGVSRGGSGSYCRDMVAP